MGTYSVTFSAGGDNHIRFNKANLEPVFDGSIPDQILDAGIRFSIAPGSYTISGDSVVAYIHECKQVTDHVDITIPEYEELVDEGEVNPEKVYFAHDEEN